MAVSQGDDGLYAWAHSVNFVADFVAVFNVDAAVASILDGGVWFFVVDLRYKILCERRQGRPTFDGF